MAAGHLWGALLLAAIAGIAFWTDVRYRRIPNWLCLVNLVAGAGYVWFTLGDWRLVALAGIHVIVSLVNGFALSAAGVLGAGDAKFYASMAAWFPIMQGLWLLVSVAVAGLVLLVMSATWRRLSGRHRHRPAEERFAKLPYGVAIGAGGLTALMLP